MTVCKQVLLVLVYTEVLGFWFLFFEKVRCHDYEVTEELIQQICNFAVKTLNTLSVIHSSIGRILVFTSFFFFPCFSD